jgi:hypothetical protein
LTVHFHFRRAPQRANAAGTDTCHLKGAVAGAQPVPHCSSEDPMRHAALLSITALALAACSPDAAQNPVSPSAPNFARASQGAKFTKAVATEVNNILTVTFSMTGLGNAETTVVKLDAIATNSFACINGGGKNPRAENKRDESTAISEEQEIPVHNGRIDDQTISFDGSDATPSESLKCGVGQTETYLGVTYSGISLTNVGNGAFINVAAP